MTYDLIIIGAGAAGLYAGAQLALSIEKKEAENKIDSIKRILIIDQSNECGKKLLLTGAGQCNLTHSENIKNFINRYGENGKKIRSLLYAHNNIDVMNFFEKIGLEVFAREDGKVFPRSLNAREVRDALVKTCVENGIEIALDTKLLSIKALENNEGFVLQTEKNGQSEKYQISIDSKRNLNENLIKQDKTKNETQGEFKTRLLLLAPGAASYPKTGSDGSIYPILKKLGLEIIEPKPALVPLFVKDFPYKALSGISVEDIIVKKGEGKKAIKKRASLLFTHDAFSGPAILHISRYVESGDEILIDYLPEISEEVLLSTIQDEIKGNAKQIASFFAQLAPIKNAGIAKRIIEKFCELSLIEPSMKASSVPWKNIKTFVQKMKSDKFLVTGTKGWHLAMVTSGGLSLDEIDLKKMQSKTHPHLFFAGEVLDIDGESGGYNLQFAFSSAKAAIVEMLKGD